MSIDISKMFKSASDAASQGMTDLLKQGGNAGLGYLEGQAVALLEADKAQHEKDFREGATEILKRPSGVDGFGAYMGNLAQSPVLKQYGPYILGGIVAVAVISIFISK